MAFNPFQSFRRYQKFWMAAVLLISMVTFVLCSGVGSKTQEGELGDMILRYFRPKGEVYATFNGSSLYSEDVARLRDQRNLANAFMANCRKISLNRLTDYVSRDNVKADPKLKQRLEAIRDLYESLQRQKNYFDGGVKLQDVVDFKAWLAEADRLGIELDTNTVREKVFYELHAHLSAPGHPHFTEDAFYAAQSDAMNQYHGRFTPQKFFKALADEFRVRMAQEALAKVQPIQVQVTDQRGADIKERVILEPRAVPTPDEMWQFFQDKMGAYPVTLLPVKAEAFVSEVGEPTPEDVKRTYDAGRTAKYDPHSDKLGFEQPLRAKIAYVTADPDSAPYKTLARTIVALRDYPIAAYSPLAPQASLLRLAAGAAIEEGALTNVYEGQMQGPLYFAPSYESSNLPLHLALSYTERRPQAIASMFAGIALAPQYGLTAIPVAAASDLKEHASDIQRAVKEEVKRRLPAYAALTPSLAVSPTFALTPFVDRPARLFLPLSIVRDRVEKVEQRSLATRYAADTITELRRKVESLPQNNQFQLARALQPYLAEKRVEMQQTDKAYSRYEVQNAKELEPLKKAFEKEIDRINMIEARKQLAGINEIGNPLEEEDFWKMFFESGERFSVGNAPYVPKPFPPDLIPAQAYVRNRRPFLDQAVRGNLNPNLFDTVMATLDRPENQQARIPMLKYSEKPFLFWKTEEVRPHVPESLAEVRDEVVRAWKLERARDLKALPFAEKMARELVTAGNVITATSRLEEEAKKLKARTVTIGQVAEFVQAPGAGYQPFSVRKGTLDDPRDEISSQILSLVDLKKPLEFKVPAIDNLNKQLYDQTVKQEKNPRGKFVQIIPNKPRTVYYVAAVGPPHGQFLQFEMFATSLTMAAKGGHSPSSVTGRGMDQAQKQMNEAVLDQLRRTYRVKIEATEKSRAQFDSDISGGGD